MVPKCIQHINFARYLQHQDTKFAGTWYFQAALLLQKPSGLHLRHFAVVVVIVFVVVMDSIQTSTPPKTRGLDAGTTPLFHWCNALKPGPAR